MGVHLIRTAVTERRSRACGVAERAVEGRREFRGIRHDRRVDKAVFVERGADRRHAAIHHVARRDHVRTGTRMADRSPGQHLERPVVVDIVTAQDAAVAVRGVLAHADVRDDIQLGRDGAERTDALLHNAVRVPCRAVLVLVLRQTEQQYTRHAVCAHALDRSAQHIGRIVILSGQRRNFVADALALDDEDRPDQAVRRNARLAHHAAQRIRRPQPPRPEILVEH